MARSLERVWEERLRRVDQVEHEYNAWRREQAVTISESDRQEILGLGEDLPRLWNATMTTSADRKQIVRLVSKRSRWIRERLARIRLDQDCMADWFDKRALVTADCPELRTARRSGPSAPEAS